MLSVTANIIIPFSEIDFSFARSSGPGGQNVNKVNSKAILRWRAASSQALPLGARARFLERYGSRLTNDGDLIIACDSHRDQKKNRDECLKRLRDMLLEIVKPPTPRRKTKPSRGSVERRKTGKQTRSAVKRNRGRVGHDD